MAKKPSRQAKVPAGTAPDYVKHGSERHANILGLRLATDDDQITFEGYALIDPTIYGPAARDDFLKTVLQQRVHELKHPPEVPQSKDPRAPNYAPPLAIPPEPEAA